MKKLGRRHLSRQHHVTPFTATNGLKWRAQKPFHQTHCLNFAWGYWHLPNCFGKTTTPCEETKGRKVSLKDTVQPRIVAEKAHVSTLQVSQFEVKLGTLISPPHTTPWRSQVDEGCYRHWNKHAPRDTQKRNVRSKIWWFTEFCNSHYVSHFAAFFIVARAKISIVESYLWFVFKQFNTAIRFQLFEVE